MSNQAFSSIVMPCLNAEATIEEAITSVLGQQDAPLELIVIDGGSSDNTVQLCRRFADSRLRINSQSDQGVADALNKGFAMARGTILGWLNADDVYVNARAINLAARAMAQHQADAVIGHSALLDRHGRVSRTTYTWTTDLDHSQRGANIFTGSLLFSKAIWQRFGGFNVNLKVAFEYELSDFLFSTTNPQLVDQLLAGLRCHPGSLSERFPQLMREELARIRPLVAIEQPKLGQRLLAHARDGTLLRVLGNALHDRYAGTPWHTLYQRSIQQPLR